MLEDLAFRVMLVEFTCQEHEFKLAQPFLFGLSSVLYQIKLHMETVGYEIPFFFLD
jgi:hypothetical protein